MLQQKKIESALARSLPLVIGFLAAFLGLGNIGAKVQNIIKPFQRPVNRVVDFAIDKLIALARAAGISKKGKPDPKDKKLAKDDPKKARKLSLAMAAIDREEKKYLKKGKITKEKAEKAAKTIKRKHPVLKSIKVVDGGMSWDYYYTSSAGKIKKGEPSDLHTGRAAANAKNKALARKELDKVTLKDINNAVSSDKLSLYKYGKPHKTHKNQFIDGYIQYLNPKTGTFQWPKTYLIGRSARRKGRNIESILLKAVFGPGAKNEKMYTVNVQTVAKKTNLLENRTIQVIPDFAFSDKVGDVKDVANLSYTEQLRGIYKIAKADNYPGDVYRGISINAGKPVKGIRRFVIIVPLDKEKSISSNLKSKADSIISIDTSLIGLHDLK